MLQLILLEKKTLLKGFILTFLISFPFTFIPVFFKDGEIVLLFLDRVPLSIIYSLLAAFAVCLSAVIYNYDRQKIKLELFSKPAFASLGFEYFQRGVGSLTEDLSFYLKGDFKDRHYMIDMMIDLEDMQDKRVFIIPLFAIDDESESSHRQLIKDIQERLKPEFKVAESEDYVQIWFRPEEINADDSLAVSKLINIIEAKMNIPKGKSI